MPERTPPEPPPLYVDVALDLPVDTLFTYAVPEEQRSRAEVGRRVHVTFRGRRAVGFIAALRADPPPRRVLPLSSLPDEPPVLGPDLLETAAFVARYYGASLGESLAALVPRGVRVRSAAAGRLVARLAPTAPSGPAPGRAASGPRERLLKALRAAPDGVPVADLLRLARTSRGPLAALQRLGHVLTAREDPVEPGDGPEAPPDAAAEPVPETLTAAQAAALEALAEPLAARRYAPFLLLGVTGSGKTEVYLRAIEACRAQGRQALVLVPEIALTPQTLRRFRARFARVAVLHSAQTEAERARAWRRIRDGEVDVVVGPRSAVFAPVPSLGLVVVDEEHEPSFKQQSAPRYHARDVGLVRARAAGAVVILGSATPALETFRNAQQGRYGLLRLPARVGAQALPPVHVVDLRLDDERPAPGAHLGRTLLRRLKETLAAGRQAILLQNRRGFATSVSCPRCGWVLGCRVCSVSLTYHRAGHLALCHLCGHEADPPTVCPDCALPAPRLHGVGTQTVEHELLATLPGVRVARMDGDSMQRRQSYEEVLARFGRGELDVLVGTQMIAKGLHFPAVTLVGIVSADTSLALPDFRAAERTFALVAQVAGRAGRGAEEGRVVLQTRLPEHTALLHAARHDFEAFAAAELEDRRVHGYPPFTRLLRVVQRSLRQERVERRAEETAARLSALPGLTVLGPAVPAVARVDGRWRRHLLVKAPAPAGIARALAVLKAAPRPTGGVEELLDVDPVGLL